MYVHHKETFYPTSFQELFSIWNYRKDAVLCAGGTGFMCDQYNRIPELPGNVISLDKLEELRKINRTERYLEIGAMVNLNQVIYLGKIVPEALMRCLACIEGPQLRNLATIGGNICYSSKKLDTTGPMIALDAQYELRSAQSVRWITASRFSSSLDLNPDPKWSRREIHGPPLLGKNELLTRIRIPLEPWNFTSYHKFSSHGNNRPGGAILFMARTQKSTLYDIRIVYSGEIVLRKKNSESMLAGKRLPLSEKDAASFVDIWKNYLSELSGMENSIFAKESVNFKPELVKTQILNFIEASIRRISE